MRTNCVTDRQTDKRVVCYKDDAGITRFRRMSVKCRRRRRATYRFSATPRRRCLYIDNFTVGLLDAAAAAGLPPLRRTHASSIAWHLDCVKSASAFENLSDKELSYRLMETSKDKRSESSEIRNRVELHWKCPFTPRRPVVTRGGSFWRRVALKLVLSKLDCVVINLWRFSPPDIGYCEKRPVHAVGEYTR